MEISEKEKDLMVDLFKKYRKEKKWVSAKQFCADHADDIEIIEGLQRKNLIDWNTENDTYHTKFTAFIIFENKLFTDALSSIEKVFNRLRDLHMEEADRGISIDSLSNQVNLERDQTVESLLYLKDIVHIGLSHDLDSPEALVIPTQELTQYAGFSAVIDEQVERLDHVKVTKEETMRLRSNQLAKLLTQAVAKTLWDVDPDMTIKDMCEHGSIQEYGGAKPYNNETTVRGWVTEVAPEHIKNKP